MKYHITNMGWTAMPELTEYCSKTSVQCCLNLPRLRLVLSDWDAARDGS